MSRCGVRGYSCPGYDDTRVLEPGCEGISVRGTRVLESGYEGVSVWGTGNMTA